MKKNEIMQKLSGYKEKLVNMQYKVTQIEKKMQYQDDDTFGLYKPLIESRLEDLDLYIFSLETNLESIAGFLDGSAPFSPLGEVEVETMIAEQVKYSEGFIKPAVKDITKLFENLEG